jgi:hypothetical protein
MPQGILCEFGAYCVVGSSNYTNCPKGTYRPELGAEKKEDCHDCEPGYYCGPTDGQKNRTPCPGGTFDTKNNSWSSEACVSCPLGQFCPAGSAVGKMCPVGTYNDQANITAESGCKPCKGGRYNPEQGKQNVQDCLPCVDNWYSIQQSAECEPCDGGGITFFTKKNNPEAFQNGKDSCLPGGWLSVANRDNVIALCSLVFCFGLLCMYCLYLDRKHPGFSHLPIFFAMMSLLEIAACCWVLSDLFRGLLQSESRRPFDWTYPATQGSLFSLLAIYGISYVFNFFSSLSWTKQVRDKRDCIFCFVFLNPHVMLRLISTILILSGGTKTIRASGPYLCCL